MDAEILQGFIEEAANIFAEMRESILLCAEDFGQISKLQLTKEDANKVKSTALMIGLPEITELCQNLEKSIEETICFSQPLSTEQTDNLLEKLAELDEVLHLLQESVGEVSTAGNYFKEEPIDKSSGAAAADADSLGGFEDFEIDAEMMEVFALEAEDLLQNIALNLTILEKMPNNREALLEVRRSSHTLKGSAGIVGLKKLSSLAHRVEDLLDFLSENKIEGDSKVFELLLAATDCLENLSRVSNSPETEQNSAELYQRFDNMLASLQTSAAARLSVLSEPQAAPGIISSEGNTVSFESNPEVPVERAENQIHQTSPTSRSVIRVSLDRLDGLVKLVNEMVISRSIFEQRILELEQQMRELNHTTYRLRRSTNRLETDFEAQALGNRVGRQRNMINLPEYPALLSSSASEFDTLEFDQYTEFHQTTRELIEATGDTLAIHNDLDTIMSNLGVLFDTQHHLIDEMQESLLRLRMVPFGALTTRLQRTVRVTAIEEEKNADLFVENESIEIDTEIIDSFVEPLIHLLRNAVAHGIEPSATRRLLGKPERGQIIINAYSEGTHIVFTITDDGRGISVEALKERAVFLRFISAEEAEKMSDEEAYSLIFLPGLSTAEGINQISGRGLGMNVVKASINRRQGDIFVSSEPQKGTTFTVRLPMSMAVTRVVLLKAREQTFAFPLKLIKQVLEVSGEEIENISAKGNLRHNGKNYRLVHFNEIVNFPLSASSQNMRTSLLLLETLDKPCALMVDELLRPQEVVIKPLGNLLSGVPHIIGATILGDGRVVPVLDLVHLLKKKSVRGGAVIPKVEKADDQVNIMIVDDSPSVRQVNSTLIKNAGWRPIIAKDGIEALEIIQTFRELPDVVLTDVEMPRMDGYELLASIRREVNLRTIPVIMITSRGGEKHRRKALDLGVSEYLSKPYEEADLIEKIRKLLPKKP